MQAQENILDPPCTPLRNSEYGIDSEPESDTILPHNISLPVSDSISVTFVKTVLEPSIMARPSPTQSKQSQSLLADSGMGVGGPGSEAHQEPFAAGVSMISQIPQGVLHQSWTVVFNFALRKYAYSTILKNLPPKK